MSDITGLIVLVMIVTALVLTLLMTIQIEVLKRYLRQEWWREIEKEGE